MDDTCSFCKIVSGKEIAMKIYEDKHTLAFLDKSKDIFGHTLIIPKKHFFNLMDCDQLTLNQTISTLKKVAKFYVDECGFSGVNVLNANGYSAEQSIPHLHFHLIPRNDCDKFTTWPSFPLSKIDLEEAYEKLTMMRG
ncbi:HIT domain-containing protein [Enterococcus casseliflavus]|nr:HIT domain-containing protein [Enterococcus casseliflavus]